VIIITPLANLVGVEFGRGVGERSAKDVVGTRRPTGRRRAGQTAAAPAAAQEGIFAAAGPLRRPGEEARPPFGPRPFGRHLRQPTRRLRRSPLQAGSV